MKENVFRSVLSMQKMTVKRLVDEMNKEEQVMNTSTFYKKLRGDSEFNAYEIKMICRILKLSKEQMLDIFFDELVSFKTQDKQEA